MENLEAGALRQGLGSRKRFPQGLAGVNQLGFVTGLLKGSGDDTQEALDSAVPGTQ